MALHKNLADHDADPPAAWQVVKVAERCWHLDSSLGHTLGTYTTRKAAEADKETGFYVSLWEKEGRWMRGEPVAGWRPYSEVQAERERTAARQASRVAGTQQVGNQDQGAAVGTVSQLGSTMSAPGEQTTPELPATAPDPDGRPGETTARHALGTAEVIQVQPSAEMLAYQAELSARIAALSSDEGPPQKPAPKTTASPHTPAGKQPERRARRR